MSSHKRASHWTAGHSKGAGSVLLYSSQHDDIPNVVTVAGRFDMCTGVKERFGEDIIERLASEKQIAMTNQRDDGSKLEWNLTKWSLQDRLDLNMAAVSRSSRHAYPCWLSATV